MLVLTINNGEFTMTREISEKEYVKLQELLQREESKKAYNDRRNAFTKACMNYVEKVHGLKFPDATTEDVEKLS